MRIKRIGVAVLAIASLVAAGMPIQILATGEETVTGSAPVVSPTQAAMPLPDIGVYFSSVSGPGIVTAVREVSEQKFSDVDLGEPAYLYHLFATPGLGGRITVCISFNLERFVSPPNSMYMVQIDGNAVRNITSMTSWTQACGHTDHVSSFAIVQDFGVSALRLTRPAAGNSAVSVNTNTAGTGASASPNIVQHHFYSAPGAAQLTITNSDVSTTGAHVWLNGEIVGTGALFKKHENNLFTPVALLPGRNMLEVSVDGPPGSGFVLSIHR